MSHHVAPVARAVADRNEDGLVLGAGFGERLVAPRVPVDRVGGVLEEVRAGFLREAVHVDEIIPDVTYDELDVGADLPPPRRACVTASWPAR
jgi:hypothetical protein